MIQKSDFLNSFQINRGNVSADRTAASKKSQTIKQQPVKDTFTKGIEKTQKAKFQAQSGDVFEKTFKTSPSYVDDRVFAYDGNQFSYDIRNDIRLKLLRQAGYYDDSELEVKKIVSSDVEVPNSKYGESVKKLEEIKAKKGPIFENMLPTSDGKGIRCKTPLSGRNDGAIKFKLGKLKNEGIATILDLRSEGECSKRAMNIIGEAGMNYVNFPVEDNNWSLKSLEKIPDFIKTIDKGDYCMGCANGQARTDLASAIDYVLNPSSKTLPNLYYGTKSTSRVSIKDNLNQILDIVKKNPDIVSKWGYGSYQEFAKTSSKKLKELVLSLK